MTPAATQSATIAIEGMTCQHCVAHVQSALAKTRGVAEATVSLQKNSAQVKFDPAKTNLGALRQAISNAGYTAGRKEN